jgi:REP element-mobilizing transposase RayT
MPNHVHVLVHVWRTPLAKLLQSWKSFTAGKANELLARSGAFWEPEYWDTFMRDEAQERKALRYIESNPVKARLCRVTSDWNFSSARFRDEYQRLRMETRISNSARI